MAITNPKYCIRSHMNIKFILYIFMMLAAFQTHAVEVNKSDWINTMSTALPTAFCNSSQYFRQCFSVSAQECEETAASATRVCLNKSKASMPAIFDQPKDGTHWGTIIGKCAGEAYEISLIQKRIKNNKCDDLTNWQ